LNRDALDAVRQADCAILALRRAKERDDNRLRLHDHQGIHNARRKPIEAGKNQTIEIAESEPLITAYFELTFSTVEPRILTPLIFVRIQVPQPGILLKSLRICSFLARRNSLETSVR
jgi:hypothetical protein